MTITESVILGIIQGLTEFLPVSSSGHLVIFEHVFGISEGNLFYSLMLHIASLLAVIIYFREEILMLLASFIKSINRISGKINDEISSGEKTVAYIIIATIPAVIAGVVLNDFFDSLYSNPKAVGYSLIFTGVLLIISRYANNMKKDTSELGISGSIFVGIFQSLAIIPGVSRSGSTITGGMLAGLKSEEAARFSFILSIPAILGASVYEIITTDFTNIIFDINIVFGMLSSFVFGYIAIRYLMKIIRKGNIHYFSVYVFLAGAFILIS